MVLFHSFFLCAQLFEQKLGSSLIYLFYLHTIIWQKHLVLFHLFFLSLCRTIRPKLGYSLFFYFYLHTTIRPRLGVILFFYIHGSTALIFRPLYLWQYCSYILYAMFMAVLPLHFALHIHCSTALIFSTLYSWKYRFYILYAIFMAIWSLGPSLLFSFTIYPE